MRIKRAPTMCCVCHAGPILLWNRCTACARMIDPKLKRRLQAMTAAERRVQYAKMGQGDRKPWTYEGREDELIAAVKQQEKSQENNQ